MANVSNKRKIAALRTARELLKSSSDYYVNGICQHLPHNSAGLYMRKYITASLVPYPFISGWLRHHEGKAVRASVVKYDVKGALNAKLKETRLAWIDWMIACLEEDIANGKLS